MAQVTTVEIGAGVVSHRAVRKVNVAVLVSRIVFFSLTLLLVVTVIPHGSSQPWWKALFVCFVFALAIFWLIEGYLSNVWFRESWSLALPLAALALFAVLQTLSLGQQAANSAGVAQTWNSVSADPYQSRFFALELLALTIAGVMLFRYGTSRRRMRITINVVICVALATALFGILRQTAHPSVLFGLPFLPPDLGYGQFINRNHFAFLMEMALGLILGLVLGGGIRREQGLVYLAALLVIWIALVLCGSRGGLLAMLAQVVVAVLLFGTVFRRNSQRSRSRFVQIASALPVRLGLLAVLIVGIVFGTVWLGGDQLATRIDQTREELTTEDDPLRHGVSREEVWKASWKLFKAHPFLGTGMGAYWTAIPSVHDASGEMTPREAHNDYLELLASGGLIGLGLGAWFAIVVVKRTRDNLRSSDRFRRAACYGAAIGIAGVAVHSLMDFGLHMIANAFVFTTLVVIATSKPQWANERESL